YIFESGICLLAGYLIYKWLLSTENQPAFNRAVLLSIYALAFTAPLLRLPAPSRDAAVAGGGTVDVGDVVAQVLPDAAPVWATVCVWIYYSGIVVAALFTLMAFIRLVSILRGGERHRAGSYTLIMPCHTKFATFSWMRYIVMARADYEEAGETILLHERAHLRLLHWIDLLLAQIAVIFLWYNPASWLMRAELRNVHEYQADDAVLQSGADARQYQLLLTKKAVGQRFPSLANSLNHSKLKNRITMMCNQKSSPARRLRALAIAPAILLAAVVVNNPSVAHALGTASSVQLTTGKGSEKNPAAQTASTDVSTDAEVPVEQPDVVPEYPGGMSAMFKFLVDNISYPATAAKQGIQGKVLVKFVISTDGRPVDVHVETPVSPELDAEAIRVVNAMPAWTPGKKDGKPVPCSMALPVTFKLPKSEGGVVKHDTAEAPEAPSTPGELYPVQVVAYGADSE
ncbi:MAG: M56 family metallopeptidase, partial [Muribaculaceae bacterium]|nr:M56 family metallopeptidase [Muribaculaceae bacterium]